MNEREIIIFIRFSSHFPADIPSRWTKAVKLAAHTLDSLEVRPALLEPFARVDVAAAGVQ